MIPALVDGLAALWPPLEVLGSLAVRAALAAVLAFVAALFLIPRLLGWLKSRQYIEVETNTDSPELNVLNAAKSPTPTLGGVMIVGSILVAGVVFGDLGNRFVQIALLSTLGYGLIGLIDDWVKLTRRERRGLPAKSKYALQLVVALAVSLAVTRSLRSDLLALHVPFTDSSFDLSWLGGVAHMVVSLLVITGASNAVNLTDGMDGLAAGTITVAALAMAGVCVAVGRARGLELERLVYVPHSQEMAVFCTAMAGAALGFLWFNAAPALLYMGDTGSLSLGSLLGYVAVVTKQELLLLLIGGVFVAEALSVIVQVAVFKGTGGRRVFRCAPLHHHFQFAGIPTTRIVVRFWIAAVLCAAGGLAGLALG